MISEYVYTQISVSFHTSITLVTTYILTITATTHTRYIPSSCSQVTGLVKLAPEGVTTTYPNYYKSAPPLDKNFWPAKPPIDKCVYFGNLPTPYYEYELNIRDIKDVFESRGYEVVGLPFMNDKSREIDAKYGFKLHGVWVQLSSKMEVDRAMRDLNGCEITRESYKPLTFTPRMERMVDTLRGDDDGLGGDSRSSSDIMDVEGKHHPGERKRRPNHPIEPVHQPRLRIV